MKLRLQCDSRTAGQPLLDKRDDQMLTIWNGDDLEIEFALFVDGAMINPYEVGSVTVEIVNIDDGTVYASAYITNGDVNDNFTLDQWEAGTSSLAVATFDSDDTESDVIPEGARHLVVTHRDLESLVTTHACSKVQVRDSRSALESAAIDPDTVNAATNAATFEDFVLNSSIFSDGSSKVETNQIVHPSVRFVPEGWNGYIYTMAVTPYILGNDQTENISIMVSNDGRSWIEPPGLQGLGAVAGNPLVPTPAGGDNYHADPDLLIDDDGTGYIYYISVFDDGVRDEMELNVISSTDGVTWGNQKTLFSSPLVSSKGSSISPAVVKFAGRYWMYTTDASVNPNVLRVSQSSSPDGGFGPWVACAISNLEGGYSPWHQEVRLVGTQLMMILSAGTGGGDSAEDGKNYILSSHDGYNWAASSAVLSPTTPVDWQDDRIYRSSAAYDPETQVIKIWYSARQDSNSEWHLGYTTTSWADAVTLSYAAGTPANQTRFINKTSDPYHIVIPDGHGFTVGQWFEGYARKSPISIHLAETEDTVTNTDILKSVYLTAGMVCRWTYSAANQWTVSKAYEVPTISQALQDICSMWFSWDSAQLDGSQLIEKLFDRSGNNRDLEAPAGSELHHNASAGLSIPSFGTDGAATPDKHATYAGALPETSGEVWVVCQGVTDGFGFSTSDSADATDPILAFTYAASVGTSNDSMRVVADTGGGLTQVYGDDDMITGTPVNILRYGSTGTSYYLSRYVDYAEEVQAVNVGAGADDGAWFGDMTDADTIALGALVRTVTTYYVATRHYEIFVFNRPLVDDEPQEVVDYLKKRIP